MRDATNGSPQQERQLLNPVDLNKRVNTIRRVMMNNQYGDDASNERTQPGMSGQQSQTGSDQQQQGGQQGGQSAQPGGQFQETTPSQQAGYGDQGASGQGGSGMMQGDARDMSSETAGQNGGMTSGSAAGATGQGGMGSSGSAGSTSGQSQDLDDAADDEDDDMSDAGGLSSAGGAAI